MADVPQVTITAGVPTAGDGTVQTLSTTNTVIGAVGETAPATDTASSGLNGRLQRIAQRITSTIALLPAALGAGGGLKVDGSGTALPVSGTLTVNAHAVTVASAGIASGAIASGAVASGAFASGALASGSVATGAMVDLGVAGDAASATGTISAKLRAIATATGVTALDLGPDTGGSRTLRVAMDTSQMQALVAHDAADSGSPIKVGGYASAAAPTSVTGADRVNAWYDLRGAAASFLTAAGALIGGDATNGLDVDVTRLPALVAGTANIGDVDVLTMPTTVVTNAVLTNVLAGEYEAVAASQTAQVLGATGAAGDYLSHVIVSPATAGCGVVTILDNATEIAAFPGGGTTALSNLIPFVIPIGVVSTSGAWKITTGANVKCVGVGNFT